MTETLEKKALPGSLRDHTPILSKFTNLYKQINAPFGPLGMDSLKVSTVALASGDSASDDIYIKLTKKIKNWTWIRDTIAEEMRAMLDGAAFKHEPFDGIIARRLINRAEALLAAVNRCASDVVNCAK